MSEIDILTPPPLRDGDTIAICSPAGAVDPRKVSGAVRVLENQGWNVRVMPHALGRQGSFAGSAAERFADLSDALSDPAVNAVLCSRGGYGVVHIMERLAAIDLRANPKWVMGFSDISALHALLASQGVASLHSSMAGDIMRGPSDPANAMLFAMLRGDRPPVSFPSHGYDRPGVADGRLVGGNLAVLADLINTPYDLLRPGSVLFIEDIAEPIYKIERIMYQLRISGVLPSLRGLIVGRFTDYRPDASYSRMEDMIRDMVEPYSYPVAFDVPIGHVPENIPVIENAHVTLKVVDGGPKHLIYWNSPS